VEKDATGCTRAGLPAKWIKLKAELHANVAFQKFYLYFYSRSCKIEEYHNHQHILKAWNLLPGYPARLYPGSQVKLPVPQLIEA